MRHRKPDEKSTANSKVKTGYFYHARLEDFSESMYNFSVVLIFSFASLHYITLKVLLDKLFKLRKTNMVGF